MKDSLETFHLSTPKTQPAQVVTVSSNPIESPSAWMQYGTSPTEIILATAVVIASIAPVIGSAALLLNALVPVMQSTQPSKKE
jgi:hypothetical protein